MTWSLSSEEENITQTGGVRKKKSILLADVLLTLSVKEMLTCDHTDPWGEGTNWSHESLPLMLLSRPMRGLFRPTKLYWKVVYTVSTTTKTSVSLSNWLSDGKLVNGYTYLLEQLIKWTVLLFIVRSMLNVITWASMSRGRHRLLMKSLNIFAVGFFYSRWSRQRSVRNDL